MDGIHILRPRLETSDRHGQIHADLNQSYPVVGTNSSLQVKSERKA